MNAHAKPSKEKKTGFHRLWMSATLALMTLTTMGHMLLPTSQSQVAQAAALPARQGNITVYVQDKAGLSLRDADAEHLDQINYAFALLEDGKATGDHWQSVSTVTKYLKRHPHITGVLSVGGWGAEGFSDATATAQGREKLAQSMLELMDQHGFRGIDLDWEYPGSSMGGLKHRENDWDNYLSLMELLRVELDAREAATGKDYILSVALGANKSLINAVDGTRLSSLVDQVNLMTYDFTGFDRTTGHHAALYPDGDNPLGAAYVVQAYADRGIPKSRMQLGAAFYGRAWRQVPSSNNGLGQRAATTGNKVYTQGQIQELLASGSTQRYFDQAAQSPWLYDGSTFISYEDAESMAAKAAYIRQQGLLGVSCWALDQDATGTLVQTLDAGLR